MISQVFYYDGGLDLLQSAKTLQIDIEDIFDTPESGELKPARVRAFSHVSILNAYSYYSKYPPMNCVYADYGPEEIHDQIDLLNWKLQGRKGENSLPHSMNGDVFTQNNTPQENAAEALGGKPEDYVTLLRLESDQDISCFCVDDAGTLYFVIAKERLANKDFSQIYYDMKSA